MNYEQSTKVYGFISDVVRVCKFRPRSRWFIGHVPHDRLSIMRKISCGNFSIELRPHRQIYRLKTGRFACPTGSSCNLAFLFCRFFTENRVKGERFEFLCDFLIREKTSKNLRYLFRNLCCPCLQTKNQISSTNHTTLRTLNLNLRREPCLLFQHPPERFLKYA